MLKFLIVIFCVIGAIAIYGDYIFSENVNDEFLSRITLSTNCEVEINSFGLKNLNTQEVTPFNHGEAFIRAKTGDELQVVFQDCNKRVTLETIFDSMNNQFGTKENN
jgi:hypothetical protein